MSSVIYFVHTSIKSFKDITLKIQHDELLLVLIKFQDMV